MEYPKGEKIAEGKTKVVFEVVDHPDLVIIQNQNAVTAFDNPKYTKQFSTKGATSTTTTCRVFELLQKAGIPVAFREQISETEFVAEKCKMIALEVVARRYAIGSCLKRHPELARKKGEQLHRFHRLVVEFFLKTTGGRLKIGEEVIIEGLSHVVNDAEKTLDDPLIANPFDGTWHLYDPKKPAWEENADLKRSVFMNKIIKTGVKGIEQIARKTFLILEGAWQILGLRLIDFKIEFGINSEGDLVIADDINNDSWRLSTFDWTEFSKQTFRDGSQLSEVEEKYGLVASLTKQFRIPQQAIVIWRGSASDGASLKVLEFPGVTVEQVTLSGHKSPITCTNRLKEIMAKYPDGGVIIVDVGRSNGLGPILAARTTWPVIAIPETLENFPDDIWSSVRMPSEVPLLTAWPGKNAVLAALNILAAKNPVVYALRQAAIEDLDPADA